MFIVNKMGLGVVYYFALFQVSFLNYQIATLAVDSSSSSVFDLNGKISIAMISNAEARSKSRRHALGHSHAMKFFQSIFNDTAEFPLISGRQLWPPIHTGNCPGARPHFDRNPPYMRASGLAHRQIWDEFAFQHRHYPSPISLTTSSQPKIVIFEDDVMEIDQRAPAAAYKSIEKMTSDVHYIGYCFYRDPGITPPLCLHAYVLSLTGVRKLLSFSDLDWCMRSNNNLDDQFVTYGKNGNLTWSVVPSKDPSIKDDFIRVKALRDGFSLGRMERWEGGEAGLFFQIKYEELEPVQLIEGHPYQAKYPSTTVYLYENSSFHAFPNSNTFAARGLEFSQVVVVPRSQLLRYMGTPLPAA